MQKCKILKIRLIKIRSHKNKKIMLNNKILNIRSKVEEQNEKGKRISPK